MFTVDRASYRDVFLLFLKVFFEDLTGAMGCAMTKEIQGGMCTRGRLLDLYDSIRESTGLF